MNTITNLVERHQLIRRLAFVWMLCFTTWITVTLANWAMTTDRDLLHVAAVIGAFMTPLSGLQGYVFAFYNNARRNGHGKAD